MYSFGQTSLERLSTCHPDLQLIAKESIKRSRVDFGIAEGHRPIQRQQDLYASGRTKPGPVLTKIDGVKIKGKHNLKPSEAFDIYAWVNGKASWRESYLIYIAGVITSTAEQLKAEGRISIDLRWGANWDMDGEIITDQTFDDLPHFEKK